MNVRFLTLAQQEVDEAVVWFEDRAEGKGIDFLDELDRVVRLIRAYPLAWPETEPDIRSCLFAGFPYSFIYALDEELIVVIAVAHFHREPRYWIDRLEF